MQRLQCRRHPRGAIQQPCSPGARHCAGSCGRKPSLAIAARSAMANACAGRQIQRLRRAGPPGKSAHSVPATLNTAGRALRSIGLRFISCPPQNQRTVDATEAERVGQHHADRAGRALQLRNFSAGNSARLRAHSSRVGNNTPSRKLISDSTASMAPLRSQGMADGGLVGSERHRAHACAEQTAGRPRLHC